MARKHPSCTSCPNTPNYYWDQAIQAFKDYPLDDSLMFVYLFLFAISTLGE